MTIVTGIEAVAVTVGSLRNDNGYKNVISK